MLLTRQQLILELIQEHPELIRTVFSWMRVDLGSGLFARYLGVASLTPDIGAYGAAASTASETVYALQNPNGDLELLVILVAQMEVNADNKCYWPSRVWNLRASQACTNVCLLVIPGDEAVAEWAEKPVHSGPHRFAPMVLSLGNVPGLAYDIPENPAACVLAALLHALDTSFPERCAHRVTMADKALRKLNLTHAQDCCDLLFEPLLTTLARGLEPMADEYGTTVEGLRASLSEQTVDDKLAAKLFARWGWRQGVLEVLLRQLRRLLGALPAKVEQRVRAATERELFDIGAALVTEAPLQALERLRDRSLDQAQMRALRLALDALVQRLDSFDDDVAGFYTPYFLREHSASLLVAKQLHLRFGAPETETTELLRTKKWFHIYDVGERLLTESSLENALKHEH